MAANNGPKTPFLIDPSWIRDVVSILDDAKVDEIEVEHDGLRLRVARRPGEVVMTAPPATATATFTVPTTETPIEETDLRTDPGVVTSPIVGTAYRASEPGARPFVEVGDTVKQGQTVLIVEAMKTMNPIPAHKDGVVRQVLVEDAQPVQYGDPLVQIS